MEHEMMEHSEILLYSDENGKEFVNVVFMDETFWLTNAEKIDPVLREELKEIYAKYKTKKYMVAVFESGKGDLYENTRDLLLFNRRRSAEKAVQQAKKQRAVGMER